MSRISFWMKVTKWILVLVMVAINTV